MTTAEADAYLAIGALTLRQVAQIWDVSVAEAFERLYERPMPTPATPPATGRQLIHYHRPPKKERP